MSDGGRARALGPYEALCLFVSSFALLQIFGGYAQRALLGAGLPLPAALAICELLFVLSPTGIAIIWKRADPIAAVGLLPASGRSIVGALVAAAGAFYLVSGGVEPLQERLVPMPPEVRDQLHALLRPGAGLRPLALDLFGLALVPAICEELLFRGVLLRALLSATAATGKRPGSPAATLSGQAYGGSAVLLVALAFGFFHASLYKLVPTTLLGVLLGALALRGRSLWPAIVAHALNNALVVVLVRAGYEDPPGVSSALLPLLLAIATGLVVTGLAATGAGAPPVEGSDPRSP